LAPLYITRIAIACSAGIGGRAMLDALRDRRSGLSPCDFDTAALDTWIGRVPEAALQPLAGDLSRFDCRNNRLAALGLSQDGFAQAVLQLRDRLGPARIGVFAGTSTSGILHTELAYRHRDAAGRLPADFDYAATHNNFSLAWLQQEMFGLSGPAAVVSTACSSSAKALGNAARMIRAGFCDAAIVGGVDSLCLTTLYGFGSLALLAPGPCRPFDARRDGISIGEGAAFLLLEKSPSAQAVRLLGIGESSDAYHMSSPHPEGLGAQLAMRAALDDAGLAAEDIDYINLHGTGTPANDETEGRAVAAVFGGGVACSSTKGWTGHTLGACGAIEAAICVLALRHGFLPGSMHTRELDASAPAGYLVDNVARAPATVMSNAFGFGGTNCSLVLGR
jgi:3-oxoacyl-[acyl-carrier-protein] synthase-1